MRLERLAAGLAATTLLTACGSGTPAPEQQPSTSVFPMGHGALAQCLAEHGVPALPGPAAGPPPGVDKDSWHDAVAACATLGPGPSG